MSCGHECDCPSALHHAACEVMSRIRAAVPPPTLAEIYATLEYGVEEDAQRALVEPASYEQCDQCGQTRSTVRLRIAGGSCGEYTSRMMRLCAGCVSTCTLRYARGGGDTGAISDCDDAVLGSARD